MARTHSGFDNHVVVYADTDRIRLRVACGMFAVCWMFFMNAGASTSLVQWMVHLVAAFGVAFGVGKAIDLWQDQKAIVGDDLAYFRAHPWNEAGRSMFAHVLAYEPTVRVAHIRQVAKAHVAHAERVGVGVGVGVRVDPIGARYFGRDVHEHLQGN